MKIGDILKKLRTNSGYKQDEVCDMLAVRGLSIKKPTLSNWEAGRREPDLKTFFALCDIYKVRDISHTFTGTKSDFFEGLNPMGRAHAKKLINVLYENPVFTTEYKAKKDYTIVKLYDVPVSAGYGEYINDSNFEEIMFEKNTVPDGTDFAVKAKGDSMEPKIHDGQILFIQKSEVIQEGEIGIFFLNGETYCKRKGKQGLVSLNKKYETIRITADDSFTTFGKVLF